jgi:hypothetical protein
MTLNLARRHSSGIERNDLFVETIKTGLILFHQLRLELRVAVARHFDLDLPAFAFERFRSCSVSGIA